AAAAAALTRNLELDWGVVGSAAPAELTGLSLMTTDQRDGWRYAHWLVSHAQDHGVKRVRFGDLEWTARDGKWIEVPGSPQTGARVVAEVFADD
ncbi:hypothetical protein ACFQZ8_02530, partial [Micromonospora azadirachtae]